jgi:tetratricopeptide (TPR) repeat protein
MVPPERRKQTIAGVAVGLFMVWLQPAVCQRPGAPPGGGGGTSPGGSPGRSGTTPTNVPVGPTPQAPGVGLFLTGRVMLEDGTPPPESVTIERVCSSSARAQGYTDPKGRFSFQLGQTSGVLQDASETANNLPGQSGGGSAPFGGGGGGTAGPSHMNSDAQLANCDLRAVLAGYRSDTLNLGGQRAMDNPDIGTIILHRLANVDGSVVSMTSIEAPHDAKREFEKGRDAAKKNKLPEAAQHLQKAVAIFPRYAAAWYDLGRVQQQTNDFEAARHSYEQSLAADAKFMGPYLQLAELATNAKNWREVADITDRLIKLDPVDYPVAYLRNAVAYLNLHETDAAEKSAREGRKLDTEHHFPVLDEILARALIRKKEYASAIDHLRAYLALAPTADDAVWARSQIAELERVTGLHEQAAVHPEPAGTSQSKGSEPPH